MQQRLLAAVGAEFDELVRVVLDAALAGDMAAAQLLLARMVPTVRAVQEPVRFELEGETLTAQAQSVLRAVSAGDLSVSDGKTLLDGIAGVVRIQDTEQTQKQLERIQRALTAKGCKQ